jgi:hypothetical protein
MPDFSTQTPGQERADEAKKGFMQVGRSGILRSPGAGAVASLPVTEGYNVTQVGQGISGEVASRNAENAALRADRGMGIAGNEKGMVTINHTGKAKGSNELVENQEVSVNTDIARAYNMQKAEHDALVAAGKRDPRVTPLPHPEDLRGGYYHGLVGVANDFGKSPDVVAKYAEKVGGRSGRADVVAGLYGAGVQARTSEDMSVHIDPSKAARFIDPNTGENHPIEHLSKFPHIMAEASTHPKTGGMSFLRSKGKHQTYITDPNTLDVKVGPQSHIGWNIENIGGAATLVKRQKPPSDHPLVRGLSDFLRQEMDSPNPMGSKSLESREASADKARGLAGLLSGTSSGRADTVVNAGIAEVKPTTATASTMESDVTARKRGGAAASPTTSGTTLFEPVQKSRVTRPTRPGPVSKQLQNVGVDEVGNPKPYAPVVGRRGDEPYYSSGRAQTYNNPFAKTAEEANVGLTMPQIQEAAAANNAAKNFEGAKDIKKPRGDVYQGVLDFDNKLTDTETTTTYDRSKLFGPISSRKAKPVTTTRLGSQWEKVSPEETPAATEPEAPRIPTSAYVKPSAGPVELFKPEVKGKGKRASMARDIKESAPLDVSRGDFRKNPVPLGSEGPQGPKVRGKLSGDMRQPEIDFGMPTHQGGAQWLGTVQRSDSAMVEKVRNTDRNWNYPQTDAGRQSTPVLGEGDFIHHKRFGGGKVVSTQVVEHPITKQPDLHVSVDFGGQTKQGMPNIRTLPMSEHGESMSKVTPESEATSLTAPSIERTKADKKRYGKK